MELRHAGNSNRAIAEALGFSVSTVYMAATGRSWSDYYNRDKNTQYARIYRQKKRKLDAQRRCE